jgi:hypothetical protein
MQRSPAANDTPRAQDKNQREAFAKTDVEILLNMWQDVEYRFDFAKATRGAHSELHLQLINVNKVFQLVFHLVIFCFKSATRISSA